MGLCLDNTISTSHLREHHACNFYASSKHNNVDESELVSVYPPAVTRNSWRRTLILAVEWYLEPTQFSQLSHFRYLGWSNHLSRITNRRGIWWSVLNHDVIREVEQEPAIFLALDDLWRRIRRTIKGAFVIDDVFTLPQTSICLTQNDAPTYDSQA